jgi:hypothetical protein
VLDCPFHALAVDDDLQGLALNCVTCCSQGSGNLSERLTNCNPIRRGFCSGQDGSAGQPRRAAR